MVPNERIIFEYVDAIIANPGIQGFAGPTYLPKTSSIWCQAVNLAGVSWFWSYPKIAKNVVPWAVTANVLLKRTGIYFNLDFPKTGGRVNLFYLIFVFSVFGHFKLNALVLISFCHFLIYLCSP